jgi:hypothetical protein
MIAADVEELVVTYLSQTLSNVGVQMPATPPSPFYLVQRIAGGDDMITDHAVVSVHSFASGTDAVSAHTAASTAARQAHLLMNPFALTPKLSFTLSSGTAFVDHVCTLETPAWRDYENPQLERYCARYRICLRMNQTS